MAQNFRSAFNGFNRDDVVHYLEYLNTKHADQINQLVSEKEFLRDQLNAAPKIDPAQEEKLHDLESRCAELERNNADLERRCAELQSALEEAKKAAQPTAMELEAYRRAERAERMANERAERICSRANGILADAAARVDDAAAQMEQLRGLADVSRKSLQDAMAAMKQLGEEI